MMGVRRGVIGLLKKKESIPCLLSVWCLAHKLELAVTARFKDTCYRKMDYCYRKMNYSMLT